MFLFFILLDPLGIRGDWEFSNAFSSKSFYKIYIFFSCITTHFDIESVTLGFKSELQF